MRKFMMAFAAAALTVGAPRLSSAMPMVASGIGDLIVATAPSVEKIGYYDCWGCSWPYGYYAYYYQPYAYYVPVPAYSYYDYYQTYGCGSPAFNYPHFQTLRGKSLFAIS